MSITGTRRLAAWASAAGLTGITEAALAFPPFNMPEGVTEVSHTVHGLHMLVFWICVAIGVGVFGVMFYSMYKHRKSKGHEAAQFHESTKVEVIWTVIPFAILIAIAIPATKALINMENVSDPEMTVKVTGYQWKWHYDYLDDGISFYSSLSTPGDQIYNQQKKGKNYLLEVNNEVVLPVGKKIRFLFTAHDVIHAWWVPDLAVKQDAIPGFINEKWTRIDKPGIYRGQCAELCGRFHGFMPIVVRAVTQNEYDAWVAQHKGAEKVATASQRPPAQGQVQN
jgi:cytochrome c oxidase subunit 2